MKSRRLPAFSLLFVAAVLIAGPGATLHVVSPCNRGAAMACCAGKSHGRATPAPCRCSLGPVAPSPSIAEAATPSVVLAGVPLPAVAAEAPAVSGPVARVAPRARSAPLHLLYSVLLV